MAPRVVGGQRGTGCDRSIGMTERDERWSDHLGETRTTAPGDTRTPAEHDRDRILYAATFRRLSGISQVAAVAEVQLLHNRAMHSIKAAQVGRRIAERLVRTAEHNREEEQLRVVGGLDPNVVEAACLAHDLGHPPFGHVTERLLGKFLSGIGGFEANAQTYRIVTKLAVRSDGPGLDLTSATLNAVAKYPTVIGDTPPSASWCDRRFGSKAGIYATEAAHLAWARTQCRPEERTAEGILMDWADDVTYALHDLEDFFRSGLIPLHELPSVGPELVTRLTRQHERKKGSDWSIDTANAALDRLSQNPTLPSERFRESQADREQLHSFVTDRLRTYDRAVRISPPRETVEIDEDAQYEVALLKELTWSYVIEAPAIALTELGQQRVVTDVFLSLWGLLESRGNPDSKIVPPALDAALSLNHKDPRGIDALRHLLKEAKKDSAAGDDQEDQDVTHPMLENFYDKTGTNEVSALKARAVADYLCSLTEPQIHDLHRRLNSSGPSSVFGTWF